jgi:alpha-amylase
VQPNSASLEVGQSLSLMPIIQDSNGAIVTTHPVTWTTSDPEVARVSLTGRVTAMRSGSATITAFADGEHANVNIVVVTSVAVVEITPDSPAIVAGTSVQLTATVLGPERIPVTGRVVSWSTSEPAVASVSAGKVRGRTPGVTEIEATAGDAKGRTVVTVLAATGATPDGGP